MDKPRDCPNLDCPMDATGHCWRCDGFKIVVDDTLPVGVIEFRHPDGRVDRVHCNFP